jgi:hypothetical protein
MRAQHERHIEIASGVFAAWSSGNADAPERYFHPAAVLNDVASGRFEGWPAIRTFFASGLARWDDLALVPDEFFVHPTDPNALALHYVMSATVKDPGTYGPEFVGRVWRVEVMSLLRFEGDRVVYEADFHDRASRSRSLGISA